MYEVAARLLIGAQGVLLVALAHRMALEELAKHLPL